MPHVAADDWPHGRPRRHATATPSRMFTAWRGSVAGRDAYQPILGGAGQKLSVQPVRRHALQCATARWPSLPCQAARHELRHLPPLRRAGAEVRRRPACAHTTCRSRLCVHAEPNDTTAMVAGCTTTSCALRLRPSSRRRRSAATLAFRSVSWARVHPCAHFRVAPQ
jgi:hypothetical protein